MRYTDVFSMVGNTPHLQIPGSELPGVTFHLKLEGCNPTGSVKDRAGARLIQEALKEGRLRPGMTILDASSGNMGCAMAFFGRILGFPSQVVASSKLTEDKRGFMLWFGAGVEKVGDFTIEGNLVCRERAEREPERYCFLDQLHSWANPRAHSEGTGPEILRAFAEVAMVVASLGSGGTLCGTASYLKEQRPDIVVVAVQAAPGTRLPGTGSFDEGDYVTPFIRKGYDEKLFDHRIKVTLDAAVARTRQLRDLGVFAGLQTGGVYDAALRAAREFGIRGDVVVLSGDSGWKNMEKLSALPV
jgi:cysteine synthase